ncbi:ribonuclease 3-like protein 1 isoform X2 [Tripterygium wilfordii]|uniref:ribonuclease 3-like protein 1 isoform X2 n=1 Tax=Tripterygium wilfordii TaxID=458696 RepID=UPI0018F80F16|nr:ribonuclease 3-like protein 1 isoform X2 [Tripterygium wilfordii]
MEKKSRYPQKFPINLKELPPILPSTITTISFKVNQSTKHREFAEEDFDFVDKTGRGDSKAEDASCLPTKHIDPDTVKTKTKKKKKKSKSRNVISTWQSYSINEGSPKKVSAKAILYETCDANRWKPPSFICCQEEGPCHLKSYISQKLSSM